MITKKNQWNEPFQGKKTWGGFGLVILKVKQIYYRKLKF